MTTPAMPTAREFTKQWFGDVHHLTESERFCEARDAQYAAQPRVSACSLADAAAESIGETPEQFRQHSEDFREATERNVWRVARKMGVTGWPKETTMKDDLGNRIMDVYATNTTASATVPVPSPRQKLAGEIAVMGEPLSMDEMKSAMRQQAHDARTPKPERPVPLSDLVPPGATVTSVCFTHPPRISRPASTDTPATCKESLQVPPTVKDSLTVPASDEAEVIRLSIAARAAYFDCEPYSAIVGKERHAWGRAIRAVLAEVRKPVDLDEAAEVGNDALRRKLPGEQHYQAMRDEVKEAVLDQARAILTFARVPIAEPAKADDLVERLEAMKLKVHTGAHENTIDEAIARLKETKA